MPLLPGKKAIRENISTLLYEGVSQKQAVAIALRKAGVPMAARKSKKGKRKHKKGARRGGHVPLPILERRLRKLAHVVASRGGHAAAKQYVGAGFAKKRKSRRKGGARKK
jgi:hypothetical protein